MKHIGHLAWILLLLTVVGGVSSCTTTSPEPIVPHGSQLDGTHWRLQWILRRQFDDIVLDDSALTRYTLLFKPDNVVGGIGDCNQFSGSYARGYNDTLYLTNLVTTLIGCVDPATEQLYFDGLSTTATYALDNDNLYLRCQGSDIYGLFFYRF